MHDDYISDAVSLPGIGLYREGDPACGLDLLFLHVKVRLVNDGAALVSCRGLEEKWHHLAALHTLLFHSVFVWVFTSWCIRRDVFLS